MYIILHAHADIGTDIRRSRTKARVFDHPVYFLLVHTITLQYIISLLNYFPIHSLLFIGYVFNLFEITSFCVEYELINDIFKWQLRHTYFGEACNLEKEPSFIIIIIMKISISTCIICKFNHRPIGEREREREPVTLPVHYSQCPRI